MTKNRSPILRFFLRLLAVLLVTLLVALGFVYGVMVLLCRGPSPAAKELFVLSTRETSAIGFLPRLCLSAEEIDEILSRQEAQLSESTDVSLITVPQQAPDAGNAQDAWGYADEDGDGLILVPVTGESFTGHMLIVLDPSRVVLGCIPESFYQKGYTVEQFAEHFGAVAGINGGGFEDPGGMGNGSVPDTTTVSYGVMYAGYQGPGIGFVGLDDKNILHVGLGSNDAIVKANIQHGTGYGPVLVVNGEPVPPESLLSGLNPRTAIGQRSDGAILMLVINGRQPNSLGATYADEVSLMLRFGAVNACNLDGGSSSLMWFKDGYLGNSTTIVGIRTIPTCFLVMPEGGNSHES